MLEVRVKETRPPHTAICVVSWANSLNETISVTVHLETMLEDLPAAQPIEREDGLFQPAALPEQRHLEAILRARQLARDFVQLEL